MKEIKEVIEYIETHLSDDISLESLKSEFYYSESYISRMFNKVCLSSIPSYISKRRLSEAAIMLKNTNKSISFIADTYRFGTPQYFSKVFKGEFNITPSEYRKGNIYITLFEKRIIKDGVNMKYKTVQDFVEDLIRNSRDYNEVLDYCSKSSQVVLMNLEGSKAELIALINGEDKSQIVNVEVDMISGNFRMRNIFDSINVERAMFEEILDVGEKMIKAYDSTQDKWIDIKVLKMDKKPRVEFNNNVIISYKYDIDDLPEINWTSKLHELENNLDQLLESTYYDELIDKLSSMDDLHLVKRFDKEVSLLYAGSDSLCYGIFSAYLDLENKTKEIVHVRGFPTLDRNYTSVFNCGKLETYAEGKLHAICEPLITDQMSRGYLLEFPSTFTGTGGWCLNDEFERYGYSK